MRKLRGNSRRKERKGEEFIRKNRRTTVKRKEASDFARDRGKWRKIWKHRENRDDEGIRGNKRGELETEQRAKGGWVGEGKESRRGARKKREKGLSRLLKSDIKGVAGRLDSVGSRDNWLTSSAWSAISSSGRRLLCKIRGPDVIKFAASAGARRIVRRAFFHSPSQPCNSFRSSRSSVYTFVLRSKYSDFSFTINFVFNVACWRSRSLRLRVPSDAVLRTDTNRWSTSQLF